MMTRHSDHTNGAVPGSKQAEPRLPGWRRAALYDRVGLQPALILELSGLGWCPMYTIIPLKYKGTVWCTYTARTWRKVNRVSDSLHSYTATWVTSTHHDRRTPRYLAFRYFRVDSLKSSLASSKTSLCTPCWLLTLLSPVQSEQLEPVSSFSLSSTEERQSRVHRRLTVAAVGAVGHV